MHGFGSTGWLDEVDGVGFRMVASKTAPMMAGAKGFSALYVVKDRYSQVKRWGNLDTSKEQPWFYMGAFIVDDSEPGPTEVRLNVPEAGGDGGRQKSKEAQLGDDIEESLRKRTGRFDSLNQLKAWLRVDEVKFTQADPPIALEMLVDEGRLVWPEVGRNKPRPGWLADTKTRQVVRNDSDHLSSPHPSDTRYDPKGRRTAVPPISRWYDSCPYHLVPPVPLPASGRG